MSRNRLYLEWYGDLAAGLDLARNLATLADMVVLFSWRDASGNTRAHHDVSADTLLGHTEIVMRGIVEDRRQDAAERKREVVLVLQDVYIHARNSRQSPIPAELFGRTMDALIAADALPSADGGAE